MSFTESLSEIVAKNANGLLGTHPSWCRITLSEVAPILNGFPFPSSSFSREEGTPLLRIRDVLTMATEAFYKGEFDSTYLVKPGELLIGMDGDFNCALWKGPPALLNQRVCKVTPDERFYGRKLLVYALPGYLSAINAATSSVTVKHLSSNTVADIPLPLPPLNEQRRIVAEIEKQFTRLEASVAALKRAQANLKRYRASVMKAACEGRLVPTEAELARAENRLYEPADQLLARILEERRAKWEADQLAKIQAAARPGRAGGKPPKDDKWKANYKEPGPPDTSNLPLLPEGWTWAAVDQLAIRVTKGTSPGWQGFKYVQRGVLFLRSQNVLWGKLDLTETVYVEQQFNDTHSSSIVREGDVLLNLVGASVGRSAVASRQADGANTNQAVGVIRLVHDHPTAKFLMLFFISPDGQAHIAGTKADVARANFNLDDIRPTPVPLPPIEEQERIVAEVERRLSVIDELEATVDANLKRAERLRQSILKRAFEGKLVPQHPNDEPASVLLERIRAEREKSVVHSDGRSGAAALKGRSRQRKRW
jgi:type I restriction enzyme S subunit